MHTHTDTQIHTQAHTHTHTHSVSHSVTHTLAQINTHTPTLFLLKTHSPRRFIKQPSVCACISWPRPRGGGGEVLRELLCVPACAVELISSALRSAPHYQTAICYSSREHMSRHMKRAILSQPCARRKPRKKKNTIIDDRVVKSLICNVFHQSITHIKAVDLHKSH